MYDFYPEWGPARHRDDQDPEPPHRRPRSWSATATMTLDPEGERPDDN